MSRWFLGYGYGYAMSSSTVSNISWEETLLTEGVSGTVYEGFIGVSFGLLQNSSGASPYRCRCSASLHWLLLAGLEKLFVAELNVPLFVGIALKFLRIHLLPSRLEFMKQLKVGAKRDDLSSEEVIQPLVSDGGAAAVHQDEVISRNLEFLV
ncbi:hypothetical protein C5167_039156 [Papaver somniferum]|uniref:Uncharacterized protein n=1 Tax=Papaver somniferum TaxID=3469 RepID=A0A4Y7IET7_PAPSO|nr:hypothetical protein C5167_039156 [Papaver somniferum]